MEARNANTSRLGPDPVILDSAATHFPELVDCDEVPEMEETLNLACGTVKCRTTTGEKGLPMVQIPRECADVGSHQDVAPLGWLTRRKCKADWDDERFVLKTPKKLPFTGARMGRVPYVSRDSWHKISEGLPSSPPPALQACITPAVRLPALQHLH